MNERKILLAPEFEYYHSLLSAYGEELIENKKQALLTAKYNEISRVIEFGRKKYFDTTIIFTDDGQGNVNVIFPSTMAMTIDENGNATITGTTFTLDDSGNLTIS